MRQRIYGPVPIAPSVNIPDTARRARGLTLPVGGSEARSRSDDPAALRLTSSLRKAPCAAAGKRHQVCSPVPTADSHRDPHRRGLTWQQTVRAEPVVDVPPPASRRRTNTGRRASLSHRNRATVVRQILGPTMDSAANADSARPRASWFGCWTRCKHRPHSPATEASGWLAVVVHHKQHAHRPSPC
jgi:hypothetical protein